MTTADRPAIAGYDIAAVEDWISANVKGLAPPFEWTRLEGGHSNLTYALVDIEGGDADVAHDIAMHVAALSPEFVDVDDVPADVLEKEKQFLIAQAADSGKPAEIIEKMVSGRMRKHLSAITLLGQDFVKDGDVTVAQLLKNHNASVKGMTRLAVGEGIEKKSENFADEVMQQVKGG